jgi:hypothetical protein
MKISNMIIFLLVFVLFHWNKKKDKKNVLYSMFSESFIKYF